MIELARHIEILLLENDCVIIPDFGGFIAHYQPEQFMTTGRIADYLSYKAESGSSESRCLEEQKEQAGVRSGESDCFDRDGAFNGTGWRV